MIRVLLLDDHELARHAARAILDATGGIEVIAELRDGDQAVAAAAAGRPDVLLVDPLLATGDGVAACRRIRAAHPAAGLLLTTTHPDEPLAVLAVLVGAAGVVRKQGGPMSLVNAVRAIAAGQRQPMDADAVLWVLQRARLPVDGADLRLLHLLADGLTDHQIAERGFWSPTQVADRVATIAAGYRLADPPVAVFGHGIPPNVRFGTG